MPPPIGSMRITSAPICAIVMPPSGAATKAEISTIRKSRSKRFMAPPLHPPVLRRVQMIQYRDSPLSDFPAKAGIHCRDGHRPPVRCQGQASPVWEFVDGGIVWGRRENRLNGSEYWRLQAQTGNFDRWATVHDDLEAMG